MRSLPISAALIGLILCSCSGNSLARSKALEQKCISEDIRPRLKDPQSLRVLDRGGMNTRELGTYEEGGYTDFTYITYTATNSYGGRIKANRGCGFVEDTLVIGMNLDDDNDPVEFEEMDFVMHREDLIP